MLQDHEKQGGVHWGAFEGSLACSAGPEWILDPNGSWVTSGPLGKGRELTSERSEAGRHREGVSMAQGI